MVWWCGYGELSLSPGKSRCSVGYSANSSTKPLAFIYRGEVQGTVYRALLRACRDCTAALAQPCNLLMLMFFPCCKSFGPSPCSVRRSFCTCVRVGLDVCLASENTVCVASLEELQDGLFVF